MPSDLSRLERSVLDCAIEGVPFDAKGREIDAEFLSRLYSGRITRDLHPHGFSLRNANVLAPLDLDGAAVDWPIHFISGELRAGILLRDAQTKSLELRDCSIREIIAPRATVAGLFSIEKSRMSSLRLTDTKIHGSLVAERARIRSRAPFSLIADRLDVSGTVFLRNLFRCSGGISLIDARIGGSLDMNHSILHASKDDALTAIRIVVAGSVFGVRSRIDGNVDFRTAEIHGVLDLSGAAIRGRQEMAVRADGVHVGGAILCRDKFRSRGQVRLAFATIGATLEFGDAEVENMVAAKSGEAPQTLSAHGLKCRSNVRIFGSLFKGQVDLTGAEIGGNLDFIDTTFRLNGAEAFRAHGAKISGQTLFRKTRFEGMARISQADIGLNLMFDGGAIIVDTPTALYADGISVGGDLFVMGDFTAGGTMRLNGARIEGSSNFGASCCMRLELERSRLNGSISFYDKAELTHGLLLATSQLGRVWFGEAKIGGGLNCARAVCTAGFTMSSKTLCEGEVSLEAARVTGPVDLSGATLDTPGGVGLRADAMQVQGNVRLRQMKIKGTVRLRNAEINGDLDFEGAQITDCQSKAIRLTGSSVKGSVFLRYGFTAEGGVRMARARFAGALDFEKANIQSKDERALSIEANGLDVQGPMIFRGITAGNSGYASFSHAHVGRLEDDLASWQCYRYAINGFEYRSCELMPGKADSNRLPLRKPDWTPMTLNERLQWLRNQAEWNVQPYEQATKIFRAAGYEEAATALQKDKYRQRRLYGRLGAWQQWKSFFLDLTLGFGFDLWRALIAAVVMIVIGTFVFSSAAATNFLVPKADSQAEFNSVAYSIDAFVPLVNLKQREAFDYSVTAAQRTKLRTEKGREIIIPRGIQFLGALWNPYHIYFWLHTALGWILTTLVAAGLTGLVRKD